MEAILDQNKFLSCTICTDEYIPVTPVSKSEYKYSLGELSKGAIVITKVCHHIFHQDCLNQWLNRKLECPNCQRALNRSQLTVIHDFKGLYLRFHQSDKQYAEFFEEEFGKKPKREPVIREDPEPFLPIFHRIPDRNDFRHRRSDRSVASVLLAGSLVVCYVVGVYLILKKIFNKPVDYQNLENRLNVLSESIARLKQARLSNS
ncbi:MAG: E3 ubiquitin protein ligase [Simkaniaceae bacterium]|nr:E3 ubiquitin protein ligase [Simkaniaceae bacterium]